MRREESRAGRIDNQGLDEPAELPEIKISSAPSSAQLSLLNSALSSARPGSTLSSAEESHRPWELLQDTCCTLSEDEQAEGHPKRACSKDKWTANRNGVERTALAVGIEAASRLLLDLDHNGT